MIDRKIILKCLLHCIETGTCACKYQNLDSMGIIFRKIGYTLQNGILKWNLFEFLFISHFYCEIENIDIKLDKSFHSEFSLVRYE